MPEEKQILDQKDIILLKLLETTKDLLLITDQLLKGPGDLQRMALRLKIGKLKKTLPKTASDIKTITKRKDLRTLSIRSLTEGDNDE